MRQTRRLLILGAAGWISSVSGFSGRAQVSPVAVDLSSRGRPDPVHPVTRDITGTWEGTFKLDSAWRLPERATASSVPARLRFNPVGDASPTTSSPRSVHPGTFEIDFPRFGFTLSTQEALGWSVTDDSLRAVLNPTVDHGLVEVHGAFRGETVVGTWRYTTDPGGATGTFEIRRISVR